MRTLALLVAAAALVSGSAAADVDTTSSSKHHSAETSHTSAAREGASASASISASKPAESADPNEPTNPCSSPWTVTWTRPKAGDWWVIDDTPSNLVSLSVKSPSCRPTPVQVMLFNNNTNRAFSPLILSGIIESDPNHPNITLGGTGGSSAKATAQITIPDNAQPGTGYYLALVDKDDTSTQFGPVSATFEIKDKGSPPQSKSSGSRGAPISAGAAAGVLVALGAALAAL